MNALWHTEIIIIIIIIVKISIFKILESILQIVLEEAVGSLHSNVNLNNLHANLNLMFNVNQLIDEEEKLCK